MSVQLDRAKKLAEVSSEMVTESVALASIAYSLAIIAEHLEAQDVQ